MMTTNKRVRFCENNMISASSVMDFSSELSNFPFSNCYQEERTKLWKPSGLFEITATNNKLYINDGSDKTASITVGEYATPALLATEIQTQLNAISSDFTVSYESSFKFKILRTSSFTLSLSNQTNAIFQSIGFTSTTDFTGTSRLGDVIANHTSEWATFDLGYFAPVDFVGIIGPVDEIFSLSSTAEIKLYADNINDFTSPAFEQTLTRFDGGVFNFFDDIDSSYRYWKIEIKDVNNINGPSCFSIGNLYLGDYQTLTSRNVENGFQIIFNDKSDKYESVTGALFFDKKPKFKTIESISLGYLERADKKMINSMFQKLGLSTPLYISIDPTGCFTDDLDELTFFSVFNAEPSFNHIIRDIFSVKTSFRECV